MATIPTTLAKQKLKLQAQAKVEADKRDAALAATGNTAVPENSDDLGAAASALAAASAAPAPAPAQATAPTAENIKALQAEAATAADPAALAAIQARLDAMAAQYPSALGRTQAEARRADEAERRSAEATARLAALEAQLATAEADRTRLAQEAAERAYKQQLAGFEPSADDLPEDQINQFDAETRKLVNTLTKKQVAPVLKDLLEQVNRMSVELNTLRGVDARVNDLNRAHDTLAGRSAAETEKAYFDAKLKPHVPDWQAVVATPAWKEFLGKPLNNDHPDVKIGAILGSYRESKNIAGVVSIFKQFQSASPGGQGLASMVTPGPRTAERPPATETPKIKTSEYRAKQDVALRSGRINSPEWIEQKAAFAKAVKEGRVEDDAGIL